MPSLPSTNSPLTVNTTRRERIEARENSPTTPHILPPRFSTSFPLLPSTTLLHTPLRELPHTQHESFRDISTNQSALVNFPTNMKSPITATFTHPSLPMESLKRDYKTAIAFRTAFAEKITALQECVLDANGDLKQFTSKTKVDGFASDCIDRCGFEEQEKDKEWEKGLFEMDLFCVLREIEYLEGAVKELAAIVPLCR